MNVEIVEEQMDMFDLFGQSEIEQKYVLTPKKVTRDYFCNGNSNAVSYRFDKEMHDMNYFQYLSWGRMQPDQDWTQYVVKCGNQHFYAYLNRDFACKADKYAFKNFQVVECEGKLIFACSSAKREMAYIGTLRGDLLQQMVDIQPKIAQFRSSRCVQDGDFTLHDMSEYLTTEDQKSWMLKVDYTVIGTNGKTHKVNLHVKRSVAERLRAARCVLNEDVSYSLVECTDFSGEKYLTLSYRYGHIIGGGCSALIKWFDITPYLEQQEVVKPSSTRIKSKGPLSVQEELALLVVVSNDRVELPSVELRHYAKIRSMLLEADATYKKGGFDFKYSNAEDVLESLLAGKKVKRKYKEFAFFNTKSFVASGMVKELGINPGDMVFESSAGQGHIIDQVKELCPEAKIVCNELWPENAEILREKGYTPTELDFLAMDPKEHPKFDVILGNPPWDKSMTEIDHFKHSLEFLKPGGKLSMLISGSYQTRETRKAKAFRDLLDRLNVKVEHVESGSFDRTHVAGVKLVIDNYQP
ncbi:hypothetical protein [Vibrio barjaei]|uniref:hypothetical protein n=1 Tax=Vibrio barjaei TaxID=1676683 RepID=UPI0022834DD9|nr:hypothetical protein [Vibrio barjaei]MCY9874512.1 hypothetical protein [Vibrio barjaei]